MTQILVPVGVSFALSLLLVPVIRRLGTRWGLVARPREDRWHKAPTPVLGGVAMFGGYAVALLVSSDWGRALRPELLLGPALVFFLGLYDDARQISPPSKLIGQILAAAVVVGFGYVIEFFDWTIPNVLLTFIWLVGITNAINLLDNMDGLAAGVSLIAAGFLAYFFWQADNIPLLSAALALFGAIAGFLVFNFPPASIFMGDSGSLFLGYTLAAVSIARTPRASNIFAVMGVPTLLFLLPILDTMLVTFTRLLRGQSPVQGGSDHTSHRLVAFGLTEKQAVLVLYGTALMSGIVGSTLESLDYDLSLVLIPLLLASLALVAAYLGRLKVVPAYATPAQGTITRFMVELTFKRRLLEVMLDFILISVAYYLAFWTRAGFSLSAAALERVIRTLPIALAGSFVSYFLFGVYRGVWRYVGVDELLRYLRAVLGGVASTALVTWLIFPSEALSGVILFLFALFLMISLVGSRLSFRLMDRIYRQQQVAQSGENSVLICGAGDAGEMTLRWILANPQLGYHPVGFLDNDPFKQGRRIHGVDVLGGLDQLEVILTDRQIDGIILTGDENGTSAGLLQALEATRKRGVWVRRLRFEFELLE